MAVKAVELEALEAYCSPRSSAGRADWPLHDSIAPSQALGAASLLQRAEITYVWRLRGTSAAGEAFALCGIDSDGFPQVQVHVWHRGQGGWPSVSPALGLEGPTRYDRLGAPVTRGAHTMEGLPR